MKPQVLLDIKEQIAYLSLERREANNTLTPRFCKEIQAALGQVRNSDAKVVLLSANSTFFSIGGDMNYFKQNQDNLEAAAREIVGGLNDLMMDMISLPIPIICAAHSVITGGSLGFVTASDLVVGSPETVFKSHYVSAGFNPDGGWATLLPMLGHQRKVAEFLMLNTTCSAQEAVDIGLVNRMVDKDQVFTTAEKWAKKIVANPSGTVRNVKKMLWGDLDAISAMLNSELEHFVELAKTDEAKYGIDAFLQKFDYHSIDASQI